MRKIPYLESASGTGKRKIRGGEVVGVKPWSDVEYKSCRSMDQINYLERINVDRVNTFVDGRFNAMFGRVCKWCKSIIRRRNKNERTVK